ncbi:MAG: dihydrofolate reductase family protein, partial [Ornithinibacter sp.]
EGRGSGLLVTCEAAGSRRLDRARSVLGADAVLVAGGEHVDLAGAVRTLAGRGLRHLLCEGGPTLLTAALAAGIVDEMALSSAPVVVGGAGSRITAGAPLGEPTGIQLTPRLLLEEAGTLLGLWRVRPVTSP